MAGARPTHDPLREQRVERVRLGICETIVPFDLRVGADEDCRAEIHSLDLGMIRIVCAAGDSLEGEVFRTPRLIRASDPDLCKIDVQVRGRGVLEQDDRQAELGPGAFSFVDLSRPCQLAGGLDGVAAVMFPRSLLPLRYRDTKQLAGVRFDPDEPNSALVGLLVGKVAGNLDEHVTPANVRIGGAIFDLIVAALSVRLDRVDAVPADTRLRALGWQVKSFIEAQLGDPALTPGRIAAAHHISLRYLYRIFEAEHTSVGSWIRGRRLDHCRRDLTDPALAGRAVSAIGARWGFVDATHFTRAFKTAYGVTPGDYRRLSVQPDRSRS
ncbi:MAG TPA: helix-turn-helix domain-containing protein [Mycobacteriales bacterium]|jgi:AraC-like DNA-binding protein